MRRPRMLMYAHMYRLQHKLGCFATAPGAGTAVYHAGKQTGPDQKNASNSGSSEWTQADHSKLDGQTAPKKKSTWKRAGPAMGVVADIKDEIADTTGQLRKWTKDLPVNVKYTLYHGKKQVSEGVWDFTSSMTQTRTARVEQRNVRAEGRRQTIVGRRTELEQAKQTQETASETSKGVAPVHERPVAAKTKQPASPATREQGQAFYGETTVERTSTPVVKVTSIHHEQILPIRTECQVVPPASSDKPNERQKMAPAITPAASHPTRSVQNDAASVTPERKRAAPVVKESNLTIRHTTAGKEQTKTGKAAARQEKGEKT